MTHEIVLIIGGVAVVICYLLYANVIKKRNMALDALASIDVQLKKRADLIPNVVKLAGRYLTHERKLIEEVTRLRSAVLQGRGKDDVATHMTNAADFIASSGRLMAQLEAYPSLRASEPMVQAQITWAEVEAQLSAARRFYNTACRELRNACEIFPSSLFACLAGVERMPFFEAAEEDRAVPNADTWLGGNDVR